MKVLLKLISFTQSRQMALKLMIQLILLEGTHMVVLFQGSARELNCKNIIGRF